MKQPAIEPAHSPFGCPSALALFLALTQTKYNHKTTVPGNPYPVNPKILIQTKTPANQQN